MEIEYELQQAFKRAGFGNVKITYKEMSASSGYGIKTSMDVLFHIEPVGNEEPVKLLEDLRGVKRIPPKQYDVIRDDR